MALEHVITFDTHAGKFGAGEPVSGDKGFQVQKADAPVIIYAEVGGGVFAVSRRKFVEDKIVKLGMDESGEGGIPGRVFAVSLKIRPVLGEADLNGAEGAVGLADDMTGPFMGVGYVGDDPAEGANTPFLEGRKLADDKAAAGVGIRFVEGVPKADVRAEGLGEFGNVIDESGHGAGIGPAADSVNPGRVGKMMEDNHGNDAGGVQALDLVDVASEFGLVEWAERFVL